jgi:gliding motility-associated-like protein
MRYTLTIFLCAWASVFTIAQTVLGRQVIGSAAVNAPSFSSTVGEPGYRLASGEAYSLKSGFEQSDAFASFEVALQVNYPGCFDGSNGVLTASSVGCGSIASILIQTQEGDEVANDAIAPGIYTVTVTSTEGCEDVQLLQVPTPALVPCDLEVFTLVTPNDDGNNDVWFIGNIDLPEYINNDVKLFNRWGQLVWNASNYDNTNVVFTGVGNNGARLPEGTYFYEVHLNGQSFTGYITLLQ